MHQNTTRQQNQQQKITKQKTQNTTKHEIQSTTQQEILNTTKHIKRKDKKDKKQNAIQNKTIHKPHQTQENTKHKT